MNSISWHTYKCQTIKCLIGLCATVIFILVLTSSPMLSQRQFRINYIWKEHIVNHFYMISTLHQGPCRVLIVWPWFISHTHIWYSLHTEICGDMFRRFKGDNGMGRPCEIYWQVPALSEYVALWAVVASSFEML